MTQEQPELANDAAQPLGLVLYHGGLPGPDEQVATHGEQVLMNRSMMFQSRCIDSDAPVLGKQVTGAQVHGTPNRSRALLPREDDMAEPELATT